MKAMRVVGMLLLALGLAVFLNGGLSLAPEGPHAPVGVATAATLDWASPPADTVYIPQWMSLAAMVLGGMVLVVGFRRP